MNHEVIITCALAGAGDTVDKHPAIPVTPKQIAAAAIDAAKAGAAIAHVHVRDPETGGIAHDTDLFLSDDDPTVAAPGTDIQTPEERHAPVAALLPEMCSLDCGSYNFADGIYVDPVPWVRRHAKLIQDAGVRPELECFDLGHVWLARQLVEDGLVDDPTWFQLCVGVPWGAEALPENLLAMRNLLPPGAQWTALGIGRMQMPIAAQSILLGGNVRVGLEDNLYLDRGVFASNGQLVERAVEIVERLGARPLTPAETRAKLDLKVQG